MTWHNDRHSRNQMGGATTQQLGPPVVGDRARFRLHTGFVGTVEASQRDDDDGYFDCELVLADERRIGAKWYELETLPE